MKLQISKTNNISLLDNLLNADTNHSSHQMRHPADILLMKIKNISSSLNECIDTVDEFVNSDHNIDPSDKIKKTIFTYVLSLDEFYDSLFLIAKALTPPSEIDNKDAFSWLKTNNKEFYTALKGSIDNYHKPIRVIANKIKHDALSIEHIEITNHKRKAIHGFYFSNVIGNDELAGPDIDIHTDYHDSRTAFSFNYFINYTIGFLAHAIFNANKIFFGTKKPKANEVSLNELYSIFMHLKDIPPTFFPDEYFKYATKLTKLASEICVEFPYKYSFDRSSINNILNVRGGFPINVRTNRSHTMIPYHRLIWPLISSLKCNIHRVRSW